MPMQPPNSEPGPPAFVVDQLAELVLGIKNASSMRWVAVQRPAWADRNYHHVCDCLGNSHTSVPMVVRLFTRNNRDMAVWMGQCPICETFYIGPADPDEKVSEPGSSPRLLIAEYTINDYALVQSFPNPGWRESIIHQLYQNIYHTLTPLIYGLTRPIWIQFFPVKSRIDKGEFGQFTTSHILTLRVTIEDVVNEPREDPLNKLYGTVDN